MSVQRVVIIGGGVTGLSLGSYLRMNGYETVVCEQNSCVGGVSVSWRRKGYTFDGATNWLPGSDPVVNLNRILREVLPFDELDIIDFEVFSRIEHPSGEVFNVYKDFDKLHEEMLRIAPEDADVIAEFMRGVRDVTRLELPIDRPRELYGIGDYLDMAINRNRLIRYVLKWRRQTIEQFARRLRSSLLREMLLAIFPRHGFFSLLSLVMPLGWMCMKSAGYPIGGSERFADALLTRYQGLQGKLELNTRVENVVIQNGCARGVRLANGQTIEADVVVSATDGHETFYQLLGQQWVPRKVHRRFEKLSLYPGLLQISLGVARTFEDVPNKIVTWLPQPLVMGTDAHVQEMIVRVCAFDPTFAPPGKTSVIVNLRCHDSDYWCTLRENDRQAYSREKQKVADIVIDALDKRFGRIRETLEVCDVATPATYVRYTNIWQASYQGWAPTPATVGRSFEKTVPGLRDFYIAGQWVEPAGGLPRAVLSARNVAQLICASDGRPFRVSSNEDDPADRGEQ